MPELAQHYTDPRLVVLYDIENKRGADTEFYLSLASEIDARTIVDLGCGTGLLAVELALDGRRVIGVDPAHGMLGIARRKRGAEQVTWIEGDSSAIGTPDADLVIMTGNVAQVFLGDAAWRATLHDIYRALRPGGVLAFESRNPADRGWERWTPEATHEEFDSPNGPMASWLEVVGVNGNRVQFVGHNVFKSTGEVVSVGDELIFRSRAELAASLNKAGFVVEHVYGDWHRGAFTDDSRTMVFVARRDAE